MSDKGDQPTGERPLSAGPRRPVHPSTFSSTETHLTTLSTGPTDSAMSLHSSDNDKEDMSPDMDEDSLDGSAPSSAAIKEEGHEFGSVAPEALSGNASSTPVQKRRRVTRACDECRRKKIKCDGKQPCTHCSVYSYECTYDKPSNRRRNPAPQYIEALEARLQRAEDLLRGFMPGLDLADPNLDPSVQQEFQNREKVRAQAAKKREDAKKATAAEKEDAHDPELLSMIETIGQLDLSEGGEWNFHGTSSGAVFLRRMKKDLQGLLGNDYRTPFLPRTPRQQGMFSLDSPRSSSGSPWDTSTLPNVYDLPDKERARTLCYYSLNCASCLLRVVHAPTFYEMFDRVYELPPDRFGHEERRFLGLLYSVLSLGCMYKVPSDDPSGPVTYKTSMEEGLKYYASARALIQDVAECRDLTSLQALIYMLLFLQVTANISGCYSLTGIALRSAIRMGLHRRLSHSKLTPIEDEQRRRAFYVIRQMDAYISAILGFPIMLNIEDIDQPLPTEVDDEHITRESIRTPDPGEPSFFQAFNAHATLMDILSKVTKHIYPIKGMEECVMKSTDGTDTTRATYSINYGRIREIEQELQSWYDRLPAHWRPSNEDGIEEIRVRTLLRFSYAHVQMMLYRPFLHYASPRLSAGKAVDERCFACAAAAVTVSRNIVHIGMEIQKQPVLVGPYWFALYTQFFAIITLVFYVLENPDKAGAAEILADARAGSEVIAGLAHRSLAADRINNALSSLFEQLPERLRQIKGRPIPSKKRSASAVKSSQVTVRPRGVAEESIRPRRSDEMGRPLARTVSERLPRAPLRTSSFDTARLQQPGGHGGPSSFGAGFPDLLPLDLSSVGDGSETSSTHGGGGGGGGGGGMQPSHNFMRMQTPGVAGNNSTLYKLDSMMFPTGDPFAYPCQQPLMDYAAQSPQARQPGGGVHGGDGPGGGGQHADSMQFYIPSLYDDIEAQLLGPMPSYLAQPHGPGPGQGQGQGHQGMEGQGHQGMDVNAQVYNAGGMLAAMSPAPGSSHGSHQGQGLTPQQRQQREMDAMLADPNFRQGDWGDMLGNGGYRHG